MKQANYKVIKVRKMKTKIVRLMACAAMVIAGLDIAEEITPTSELAQHLLRTCNNISASLANM